MTATMRAIVVRSFGGPEVLRPELVPVPVPAPDELLVEVVAAGVNPVWTEIKIAIELTLTAPTIQFEYKWVAPNVTSGDLKLKRSGF